MKTLKSTVIFARNPRFQLLSPGNPTFIARVVTDPECRFDPNSFGIPETNYDVDERVAPVLDTHMGHSGIIVCMADQSHPDGLIEPRFATAGFPAMFDTETGQTYYILDRRARLSFLFGNLALVEFHLDEHYEGYLRIPEYLSSVTPCYWLISNEDYTGQGIFDFDISIEEQFDGAWFVNDRLPAPQEAMMAGG